MHRHLLSSLVPDAASDRPAATAVVCGDDELTWAEFDRRIGKLAATLVENGVHRGDRVGIYLHKTIESMVAVHGILRAGAAYVPIDPLAPIDLVETIIADCGIEAMVTHGLRRPGLSKLLPKLASMTVVGVDDDGFDAAPCRFVTWADVATADPIAPAPGVADDLAYVMYTSGSTGRPKGIMHTHASGLAYARMAAAVYELGPDDRLANFSPLHFDMSTFEVFAGVSAGACAVLVPEPHLRMPASLTEYLSTQRVTTLYTVPSLLIQMMTRGAFDQRDWSSLRWIMPAGEVFPPEPLRELRSMVPEQVVFSNVYGPAEVNQITHHHLAGDDHLDGAMPIGHASPGVELALIDNDGAVIDGSSPDAPATGELIARTATMMAGYWGRPDLDDAGFLHLDGPGGLRQRWYRTGDLCRRDDQGLLHYLGRRDNQVKVRGYRVELEVVEAAVGSLPGVEQAVVGLRPSADGDGTLVARYVPTEKAENAAAEWRAALSATLPGYAIPGDFEPVEVFPLTPSGKIDRRTVRRALAHRPDGRSERDV